MSSAISQFFLASDIYKPLRRDFLKAGVFWCLCQWLLSDKEACSTHVPALQNAGFCIYEAALQSFPIAIWLYWSIYCCRARTTDFQDRCDRLRRDFSEPLCRIPEFGLPEVVSYSSPRRHAGFSIVVQAGFLQCHRLSKYGLCLLW